MLLFNCILLYISKTVNFKINFSWNESFQQINVTWVTKILVILLKNQQTNVFLFILHYVSCSLLVTYINPMVIVLNNACMSSHFIIRLMSQNKCNVSNRSGFSLSVTHYKSDDTILTIYQVRPTWKATNNARLVMPNYLVEETWHTDSQNCNISNHKSTFQLIMSTFVLLCFHTVVWFT